MKLFGKEIPVTKVNFVMNVVSFIGGIIFLSRFFFGSSSPEIIVPAYNSEMDSLIKMEARLSDQVQELKIIQDSLVKSIKAGQEKLASQQKEIIVKRRQLYSTLNTDWDVLSSNEKNAYVSKIMSNLSAGASAKADLKEKHK